MVPLGQGTAKVQLGAFIPPVALTTWHLSAVHQEKCLYIKERALLEYNVCLTWKLQFDHVITAHEGTA